MRNPFKHLYLPLLFLFLSSLQFYAQDSRSFSELNKLPKDNSEKALNDGLDRAYKSLNSFGSFTEKTNSLTTLDNNYSHERTLYIIIALLDYNYIYNNPQYRESNQKMYENDIIVEKLVRILGRNGNPKCFPTLLNVVIHPERHRDATVSTAYTAMTQLKW